MGTHRDDSMPSKRELIGDDPSGDGRRGSNIRWNRILAFCGGIVTLVGIFSFQSLVSSQHLLVWAHTGLAVVPVGLFWYSFTTWRWQTVLKATAGIAAGSFLAVYIP